MADSCPPARVAPALQQEIEQFLYAEAALLDARDFDAWLTLLAHDLHYFMPLRRTLQRRERELEISAPDEVALFDEDKPSMEVRVRRLNTGLAWAEEPPSRTRHLVSNVRVHGAPDAADEYAVQSSFHIYRSSGERHQDAVIGKRFDRLRRAPTPYGFVIARRTVVFDMATLLVKNLSLFY